MMKNQKPLFILLTILLLFILVHFVPWQAILLFVFMGMLIFALFGHTYLSVKQERSKPIPVYQPPTPQATPVPSPPPSEEPKPVLAYEQGYQPQITWSPFTGITHSTGQPEQPKQDNVNDYYEQPQTRYPQELPPI